MKVQHRANVSLIFAHENEIPAVVAWPVFCWHSFKEQRSTMKWAKRIGVGSLLAVMLLSVGFVGWTQANRYVAAPAAVVSTPTARANGWLVFQPEQPAERGFIFYPGGLVDPQAYAPLAKQFAERGILTVIVPMPLDLAILNPNEANEVLARFPDVKQWAIGGHSLGGAMAAQFLASNPQLAEKIDGLVLWGARAQADVSELPVNVVSIFGTRDGIAPSNITDDMRLAGLPASTQLVPIEGGNHSMFGDYGLQRGDNVLTVSLDLARAQIVDATMSVFQ